MADITKCAGTDCGLRDKCYRYTAPESEHQEYEDYSADSEWWGCRMILADPAHWIQAKKEVEGWTCTQK